MRVEFSSCNMLLNAHRARHRKTGTIKREKGHEISRHICQRNRKSQAPFTTTWFSQNIQQSAYNLFKFAHLTRVTNRGATWVVFHCLMGPTTGNIPYKHDRCVNGSSPTYIRSHLACFIRPGCSQTISPSSRS